MTLGRLGVFDMRAGSLALAGAATASDPTVLAAKRVFGIGDPLLLERRAGALAEAAAVPIEALDLALANWAAPERATLGFPPQSPTTAPSSAPPARSGSDRPAGARTHGLPGRGGGVKDAVHTGAYSPCCQFP